MTTLSASAVPLVDIRQGDAVFSNYVRGSLHGPNGENVPVLFDVYSFLPDKRGELLANLRNEMRAVIPDESGVKPSSLEAIEPYVQEMVKELDAGCKERFEKYGTFDADDRLQSITLPDAVKTKEKEARGWIKSVANGQPDLFKKEVGVAPKILFTDHPTIEELVIGAQGRAQGFSYKNGMSDGYKYVFVTAPQGLPYDMFPYARPEALLMHELTHVIKLDEQVAKEAPDLAERFDRDTQKMGALKDALMMGVISSDASKTLGLLRENGLLSNEKSFSKLPKWQAGLISSKDKPFFFRAINGNDLHASSVKTAVANYASKARDMVDTASVMRDGALGEFIAKTGQSHADEVAPFLMQFSAVFGTDAARGLFPESMAAMEKVMQANSMKMGNGGLSGASHR